MADTTVIAGTDPLAGMTIGGMGQTAAHAKPARRDILLWAVAVIAGFALYDIWGAWAEVGDKSGFAHGTGWTLTVIVEVFGVCALCAWLAPAGPRSRRFAMWSAVIVFVLSLAGQASSHLTARTQIPPAAVVVFVSVLPVIVLALIAVLVHLRHLDRADTAEAVAVTAAAQELAALRAGLLAQREASQVGLDALRIELETVQAERDIAQRELAETLTRAETLTQKLDALKAKKGGPKPSRGTRGIAHADDLTIEFRALELLRDNPELRAPRKGAELGRRLEASAATGNRLHRRLIVNGQLVQPLTDRFADRSLDQSGERS